MTTLLFLLLVACAVYAEPVNRIRGLRSVESPANVENVSGLRHSRGANFNEYYLFTRRNPTASQSLFLNDANSITSSNFNARNSVVVVIHGWVDNSNSSFNAAIREAYLKNNEVNIIMVDWGTVAAGPYGSAVDTVPEIGREVAQFIDFLIRTTGVSFNNIHIVGFSLGAHVAGNAGRTLGGKVARITGLDPAGPLWYGNEYSLRPSDAVYVEAIHSDGSLLGLGIAIAVADADFFPNGGTNQPGCPDLFCNHNRAWELFAATVVYDNLVANECTNMLQVAMNSCRGKQMHMGNGSLTKRGTGLYRVNTKAEYPF